MLRGCVQTVVCDNHKCLDGIVRCGSTPKSEWIFGDSNARVHEDGKWAEIVEPLFTTEDGVEIYEGDEYWFVRKYDFTMYSDRATSISGDSSSLKYFSTKEAAQKFVDENKEKTLEGYEKVLLESRNCLESETHNSVMDSNWFWGTLKANEPKLFYTKVLTLITEDLNEGWKADFSVDEEKRMICHDFEDGYCSDFNYTLCKGIVFFRSKDLAIKAIKIMGDKLDHIFGCK